MWQNIKKNDREAASVGAGALEAPTDSDWKSTAAMLVDHCCDSVAVIGRGGAISHVNKAFCRTTGYLAGEVSGAHFSVLYIDGNLRSVLRGVLKRIRQEGHWYGELWLRRKDGSVHLESLNISGVRVAGLFTHYLVLFLGIPRSIRSSYAWDTSLYDFLTALPSRLLLEDRLQLASAAAQRIERSIALLLVDLDHFKHVNDTLGYAAGDTLLKEVAVRLRTCVREEDTVARLGGDQFVVLMTMMQGTPDEVAKAAALAADKIIAVISQPCLIDGNEMTMVSSVGIALSIGSVWREGELLQHADAAMCHAKKQGGGYHFYDARMNSTALERLQLDHALWEAIRQDEFVLNFQPQIGRDGQLTGMEALLRWPKRQISPAKFIPIAEDSGAIVSLGAWVLEEACRRKAEWNGAGKGKGLRVAVNVSPRQFRQSGFVDTVRAALEKSSLDPVELELELTEGMLVHNVEETAEKLRRIKALGVKLSIDDFGTGYSSLSYLKHFPIDMLKIDRSFVHDLESDVNDAVIVKTIIAMAHSLGLKVVAEGVETESQFTFLRRYSCDHYQGYWVGEPLSVDAMSDLLGGGTR